MLHTISLEIIPELVAQNILSDVDLIAMQNTPQPRGLGRIGQRRGIPIELRRFTKAHDQDALAVLRDETTRVENPGVDTIAQFVFENIPDHRERISPVVRQEVLHVLQQKRPRSPIGDNSRNIEEKSALGLAFEPMRPAQRILLRNPRDAERLARKS